MSRHHLQRHLFPIGAPVGQEEKVYVKAKRSIWRSAQSSLTYNTCAVRSRVVPDHSTGTVKTLSQNNIILPSTLPMINNPLGSVVRIQNFNARTTTHMQVDFGSQHKILVTTPNRFIQRTKCTDRTHSHTLVRGPQSPAEKPLTTTFIPLLVTDHMHHRSPSPSLQPEPRFRIRASKNLIQDARLQRTVG